MRAELAAVLFAFVMLTGLGARGDAPRGQGQRCNSKKSCPGKLLCVARKDAGGTCELTCSANAQCPADQRCVKDGDVSVCRPITDEDTAYKQPGF